MRAHAVIGANWGDEGKGLVTDWLASQGADYVVRFNGGAQAGHTVVTSHGHRHVFRHFGSGTLRGVPTYLSRYFVVNPLAYFREKDDLAKVCPSIPHVCAHPECLVTTFADMIINQELETQRGDKRHGSVGMGVNETVERSSIKELKITMADLWNNSKRIEAKLVEACDKYSRFRIGKAIDKPENMIAAFLKACDAFANDVSPMGIGDCKDPVFEGAQGLLLDQNNKENFPHVTRSNTGIKNVRALCSEAGIDKIEAYYVSRTYLTKHGAGPLPGETTLINYPDETNGENEFQGKLRFAPLNYSDLHERIYKDFGGDGYRLVLTHVDQEPPPKGDGAKYYAYGPSAEKIHPTARYKTMINA